MTTALAAKATTHYAQLTALLRDASVIGSVGGLLGWDQETYMPAGAAPARAQQSSLIARIHHERLTDPRLGDLLAACEYDSALNEPGSETAANLREIRRDYNKATKVPSDLVAEMARTGSEAQDIWKHARAKSDFPMFAPALTRVLELTRRKAECLGVPKGGELYDALLDQYEPDARAADIEAVFNPLRERLSALIAEVAQNGTPPTEDFMTRAVPVGKQHTFGQAVLEALGFDFTAGRLDVTTHPFCSGMAPGRHPPDDPLCRGQLRRRADQQHARGWPRAVRAGPAEERTPRGHAAGGQRLAGHPRVPEPHVGELRRALRAVLEVGAPAGQHAL